MMRANLHLFGDESFAKMELLPARLNHEQTLPSWLGRASYSPAAIVCADGRDSTWRGHSRFSNMCSPRFLSLTRGLGMLCRNIQGTALVVFAEGDVEVWPVQAFGVALTDAVGVAATAGRFREASLDHGFGDTNKALDELLLPTH